MKKQVFFIHGGEAYSSYDAYLEHLKNVPIEPFKETSKRWSKTLREDLGEEYEVFMPSMPSSHNAKYEEWKIWFERHFEFLKDNVILAGWSQGGWFLAKYLSQNTFPYKIGALYLLAAPFEAEDFGGEDGGDFVFDTNLLPNMAKQVENIKILHSEDDFVVPYSHSELYLKALPQADHISFDNKGHFLIEEFPELISMLHAEQ